MSAYTDIFLCYRCHGAQTAKSFKNYMKEKSPDIDVWYSTTEQRGNFIHDIPDLIQGAKAAVIFVDKDFTKGFDKEDKLTDIVVTRREIIEILARKRKDKNFGIILILIDREKSFTEEEIKTLLSMPNYYDAIHELSEDDVTLLTGCNPNKFRTDIDCEANFFNMIRDKLLNNIFY